MLTVDTSCRSGLTYSGPFNSVHFPNHPVYTQPPPIALNSIWHVSMHVKIMAGASGTQDLPSMYLHQGQLHLPRSSRMSGQNRATVQIVILRIQLPEIHAGSATMQWSASAKAMISMRCSIKPDHLHICCNTYSHACFQIADCHNWPSSTWIAPYRLAFMQLPGSLKLCATLTCKGAFAVATVYLAQVLSLLWPGCRLYMACEVTGIPNLLVERASMHPPSYQLPHALELIIVSSLAVKVSLWVAYMTSQPERSTGASRLRLRRWRIFSTIWQATGYILKAEPTCAEIQRWATQQLI